MLKSWPENSITKDKNKEKMIQYCCFMWTQETILRPAIFWPKFGSNEDWVCRQLIEYVNDNSPVSQEEINYVFCWWRGPTTLFPLKVSKGRKEKT
jgi:hypothetical protein